MNLTFHSCQEEKYYQSLPGDRASAGLTVRVLLPLSFWWTETAFSKACRYFSCSMLLEDSKEEVGTIKEKVNKTNCLYVNKRDIYLRILFFLYIIFKLPHPNIETRPTLSCKLLDGYPPLILVSPHLLLGCLIILPERAQVWRASTGLSFQAQVQLLIIQVMHRNEKSQRATSPGWFPPIILSLLPSGSRGWSGFPWHPGMGRGENSPY